MVSTEGSKPSFLKDFKFDHHMVLVKRTMTQVWFSIQTL